jgi:type II secretory pathway component PulM
MSRSLRERWLIALMLAIALPMLSYFAVYRPLMQSIERAQQRHVSAVRNHGLVLARLTQLEQAQRPEVRSPPTGNAPLSLRITDAAALAGVSLTANEPRGNESALITLAPSAPAAPLRWLRQMEEQGVSVRELAITPQPGGQVIVTATLSQVGER